MSALSSKLRKASDGKLMFRCPGCNELHGVAVGGGPGPRWSWNGDAELPTFSPSILVTWNEPSDKEEEFDDPAMDRKMICHSFVTDGVIRFLTDCTHALAGTSVEIPDLDQGAAA